MSLKVLLLIENKIFISIIHVEILNLNFKERRYYCQDSCLEQWPSVVLDSYSRCHRVKTTGWLEGWHSLSVFPGLSIEYQKLLGHLVVKSNLSPLSGSIALRQLNPIQKNGLLFFFFLKKRWLLFYPKLF